jgi:hypothetical protein
VGFNIHLYPIFMGDCTSLFSKKNNSQVVKSFFSHSKSMTPFPTPKYSAMKSQIKQRQRRTPCCMRL